MPVHILTLNSGSSSVRFEIASIEFPADSSFPVSITPLYSFHSNFDSKTDGVALLQKFLSQYSEPISEIRSVIHRVVHGGSKFNHATLLSPTILKDLESLNSLAPLHNPPSLRWINESIRLFPAAAQIAVFDTNFFWNLPEVAQLYAIPQNWVKKYSLRRYGFHGFAHQSMLAGFSNERKDLDRGGNIITLQLGSGCSVAAISRGRPVDTSMGFSPLEGLIMSTRSGDIDAALVAFIARQEGLTGDQIEKLLYNDSGLLGIAGERDMAKLELRETKLSALAVDAFCYRIIKYIGAYIAVLGKIDGIVFGGGIGENGPLIRKEIILHLEKAFPIELDQSLNSALRGGKSGRISAETSKISIWVIGVDESKIMIEEAMKIANENLLKNYQKWDQNEKNSLLRSSL